MLLHQLTQSEETSARFTKLLKLKIFVSPIQTVLGLKMLGETSTSFGKNLQSIVMELLMTIHPRSLTRFFYFLSL